VLRFTPLEGGPNNFIVEVPKKEEAMPNLASILNEEIRRLARKEIRTAVNKTQKQVAEHRREIADLKRINAGLIRRVTFLEKREK